MTLTLILSEISWLNYENKCRYLIGIHPSIFTSTPTPVKYIGLPQSLNTNHLNSPSPFWNTFISR